MQAQLYGLDAFKGRDRSIIGWTDHVADGPGDRTSRVPHRIW